MAEQRLELLQKKDKPQYASGSPILLLASALYLDRSTNNCIAQLKWENIDQRAVKAVMIEIHGRDAFDQGTDSIQYQYDGLMVNQGSEFGAKTPIMIKNNKIVKFTVSLKAVSFADETVWRPESELLFSTLPDAKKQNLTGELLDQLKRDLSKKGNKLAAAYTPQIADGLWQCGCGSWQNSDSTCLRCKSSYKSLLAASEPAVLQSHLKEYKEEQEKLRIEAEKRAEEERIAREKADEERRIAEERSRKEAAERQRLEAEKKKKRRNRVVAIVAVIALVVGGYFAYDNLLRPRIEYNQAQALLDEGKFDEAYAAFNNMLEFCDSKTKLLEINYKKAERFLAEGKLAEARQYFGLASGYADASKQIENIDAYIAAETDYNKNDLVSAGKKYYTLGSFLDSAEKFESISSTLYAQATSALADKDYEQAYSLLTILGDYSDSKSIIQSVDSEYASALTLWENGEKQQAEQALQALVGWKDTEAQLSALRLEIADDAAKSEDYDTALAYYSKVPISEEIESKIASATKGKNYQEAVTSLQSGDLETAYTKFISASDHKDAGQQATKIKTYQQANELFSQGKYEEARAIYVNLGDYLSSNSYLVACNKAIYQNATELYNNGNLAQAYQLFTLIAGYSNSTEIVNEMDSDYLKALEHIEKGEWIEAEAALAKLTGWRDVSERLETTRETIADKALETNDYDTAISYYNKLNNKSDSIKAKLTKAEQGKSYSEATSALEAGDLETAYAKFTAAGDHKDAADQASKLKAYQDAIVAMAEGKYQQARSTFIQLGAYLDSVSNLETCNASLYQEATEMKANSDYAKAYELFVLISGYSNSTEIAQQFKDDYKAADDLLKDGKYDEANAAFLALYNYSDSPTRALEALYQKAESLKTAGSYDEAVAVYKGLGEYKDSANEINVCLYEKAEGQIKGNDTDGAIATFESIAEYSDSLERAKALRYEKAKSLWDARDLQAARKEYEALGDYSDSAQLLLQVLTAIADESMASKDYAAALSAYQGLEQTAEIQEREYTLAQICYDEGHYEEATSAYEKLGQYELSLSKLPIARYAWADQLFKNGEYAKAAEQFTLLGDMTDSATRAKESVYQLAKSCLENKDYDTAKSHFASIPGYSDADTMCKECDYRKATDLLSAGKNKDAETIFKALGDYSDSKTKAEQCIYNQAEILFSNGKYEEAKILYDTISYSDSATKAKQCVYNVADALFTAKDYSGAKTKFASIDYLDSKERAKESAYQEADVLYQDGKFADAETVFLSIAGYNDSNDRAKDSHLQQGVVLMDSGRYQEALVFFESEDYANSTELAAKCYYELGRVAHLSGKTDDAIAKYAFAVSLTEAQDALISIAKDYVVINEPEKAIQTLWLVRNRDEAKELLVTIAETESTKGNIDNSLIAYSSLEQHPEVDFRQLIQSASFASVNSTLDNYKLLPSTLQFNKFVQYRFAFFARDYHYYDLSVEAFTKAGDYEDAAEQIKETRYLEGSYVEENGDQEKAYSIFTGLGEYRDSYERANKPYYDLGLNKQKEGKWGEAVTAFEHAGSYSDAPTQILATRFLEGMSKYDKEDWDGAYDAFNAAGQYENANEYAKDCLYQKANSLSSSGNYTAAFELYASIRGYKDVDSIIQSNKNIYSAGRDLYFSQTFKKNNIISFGRYGNTGIQWRILDINKDEVLLISEYIIDYIPFNDENTDTPWEQCTLRKWLNGSFVKTAFSDSQQAAILTKSHSCNVEDGNPDVEGKRIGGKATKDKIFLFSYVECKTYFNILKELPGASKYAETRNKYSEHSWWLRNIYDHKKYWDQGHAEYFGLSWDGSARFGSAFVSNDDIGVRPAIWITTKAKMFEEEAKSFIIGK